MVQSRIPNHPVNFISHISRRCFSSDTSTVDANSPPSPPLPHFSDLASAVEDVGEQDEHVELLIGDFEIGSASQDENNEFYNNDDLAISDIDSDTEVSVDASVDEDVAEIVEIGGEIESLGGKCGSIEYNLLFTQPTLQGRRAVSTCCD